MNKKITSVLLVLFSINLTAFEYCDKRLFGEEIITTKEGVILDDFSKKITYCFGDGNTDELSILHFEKAHTYFLNGIEILETQFLFKENIEIFYDAYFGEIIENYGAEDAALYLIQRADEISKVADFYLGDKTLIGYMLITVGIYLELEKLFEEALASFDSAQRIYQTEDPERVEPRNKLLFIIAKLKSAGVYLEQGNVEGYLGEIKDVDLNIKDVDFNTDIFYKSSISDNLKYTFVDTLISHIFLMNVWEDAILDYKIHSELLTEIYRKFIDGELPFPPPDEESNYKKDIIWALIAGLSPSPYNANHPICKIDSKKIIDFIGNLGKSEVLKSICEKNIDKSKIYAILDDESEKKKVLEAAECFYFEYDYSCNIDGIIDYMSMAHSMQQDLKIYEAVTETQALFKNIKDFKILNEDNFGTFSIAVVAEIMRETEGLQKSSNTTIRKFLNIEDMFLSDKAKEEMKIDRRYATSIMKNLIALLQSFSFSMFAIDSLKIDQKEWVQISIFISDLFAFINEICIEQNAIISKSTDIFSFDVKDPSTESLNALMLESIHLIEVLHAYAYKEGFNELFSRASYENFIEAYLFVTAFNDSSDISKMIRMNGIAKKIENREAKLDFLTHQILQKQLIDIESKKIIFQDNPNLIFSQQDIMAVIDEYKTKLRKHYRSGNIDLDLFFPVSSEKSIFDDINHTEQIIYIDYQPDKIHTILVNCIDCKRINEDKDIKYSYFSHYIDDDDDQQIRNYIDSIKTYPPTKDFYDLNVSVSKIFSNLVDICNIKNSNLTIITSNNLKEFPFHTIKDLATDKFIIENCSINYLPSLQSYGFLSSLEDEFPREFVGIGNPSLGGSSLKNIRERGFADVENISNLPSLKVTEEEINYISNFFEYNDIFLGDNASEKLLKDRNNFNQTFTYFGTHSIPYGTQIYQEPGLILTPPINASKENDGLLTHLEVSNMSFTNSFVSLAACSTFDALYQGAEKYTGLPEAFFSSGANGLIITMWNIENLSASEFNKRTLEKVFRQKKNFAEAIQETSREFIKSEDYNHPYFWGPFIYLGKN